MSKDHDAQFAAFAVDQGYLKQEQLDVALEVLRRAREELGLDQNLGEVLVAKSMLTPKQAQEIATAVAMKTGDSRLIAGYEVIEKIGQGGMGSVYKARSRDSERVVAIKILLPALATPDYIERFLRETRIVQQLNHPNIVRCFGSGQDESKGLYYCALDFVSGADLGDHVDEQGRLNQTEALLVARQIADALQHAYEHGLVHRDIKPENILLSSSGAAMLLDLGACRTTS